MARLNVVATDSGRYHQHAGVVIETPDRLLDGVDFALVEIRLTALATHPRRDRIHYQMVAVAINMKRRGRTLHLAFAVDTIHLFLLVRKSASHSSAEGM